MEEILEAIRAATGLKENQGLSFEEQLELIKPVIEKELNLVKKTFFLRGLNTATLAIKEEIQKFENQ